MYLLEKSCPVEQPYDADTPERLSEKYEHQLKGAIIPRGCCNMEVFRKKGAFLIKRRQSLLSDVFLSFFF